jgi:4-amino-4-deoxy-L-arabinose transferase-like glycosyltransferase
VTFAAARRWGAGTALLAAALIAVNPNHVRESHYVLTDVPTAFFTTLTLLLSLRAYERPTIGRLLWAAASAGLAASCKYNGAIAIVMPLIVALTSGGGLVAGTRRTLAVIGIAVLAFLAGTPYAVLDLPAFLNDYARLASTFARERPGEAGWSLYLKHVSGSLAWPAFLLAIGGGLIIVRRILTGPARVPALMVTGFTLVYFVVMARSFQIYGRYMLPLYPALSIMAAVATVGLMEWSKRAIKPRAAAVMVTGALVAMPLAMPTITAVSLSQSMGRRSTIDLAYEWILAHVPPGAKVAVETGGPQLPSQYQTLGVKSLTERSYDDYVREGVTYFVASSPRYQAALTDPRANADASIAYRTLLDRTAEVAEFDASPGVGGPSVHLYRIGPPPR